MLQVLSGWEEKESGLLELRGPIEVKDAYWSSPEGGHLALTLEGKGVPDVDECDLIYTRVPEHVKVRFEPRGK